MKQLSRTLIFFLIVGLLTPNFKEYLDYYYNFGGIKDGIVEISAFLGIILSTVVYFMCLKDTEIRKLQLIAILFNIMNCALNVCLARGYRFGLTMFQFVLIQMGFFDSTF